MTAVKFELGADGIALVTLDMPGRSMNVLNDELMGPFAEVLTRFETDAEVKGMVLTSGKKKSFWPVPTWTLFTKSPNPNKRSIWPKPSRACCAEWKNAKSPLCAP